MKILHDFEDDKKDIVFIISYLPLGRMLRRVKTAAETGSVAIICWDRIIENKIENKIHDSIKQIRIAQKASEGSPLKSLSSMFIFTIKALSCLKRLNPKVIHTELFNMLFIAVLYKLFFLKKVNIIYEVSDLHTMLMEEQKNVAKKIIRRLLIILEKYLCRYVNLLIITSPYFYDEHYFSFIESAKVLFIPNAPENGVLNNFKRKESGEFTVGFIGYVRYKKQLEMLMRVSKYCNVNVLIAGVGPDYQHLYEKYKKTDNVCFYGPYDYEKDIKKLYESVDCVYSVYDTELKNVCIALPNKLYESIICNLPIIVAKNTKLAELVTQWGVGVEVSDIDDSELEASILKLKNDRKYMDSIRNNCASTVVKISSKQNNEAYKSVLRKAI